MRCAPQTFYQRYDKSTRRLRIQHMYSLVAVRCQKTLCHGLGYIHVRIAMLQDETHLPTCTAIECLVMKFTKPHASNQERRDCLSAGIRLWPDRPALGRPYSANACSGGSLVDSEDDDVSSCQRDRDVIPSAEVLGMQRGTYRYMCPA